MKLGMKGFQMPGADMFWRHLSDECGFMSDFENLNIWNYNTEFDTKKCQFVIQMLYKGPKMKSFWTRNHQNVCVYHGDS